MPRPLYPFSFKDYLDTEFYIVLRQLLVRPFPPYTVLLKTEESMYSEVLRGMRNDSKLHDLGTALRNIRRSRTDEMILQLKRDTGRNGSELAEKVLGDGVNVRALTTKALSGLKIGTSSSRSGKSPEPLEQSQVTVTIEAVRRRNDPQGTQVAIMRVSEAESKKVLNVGKLKIGWLICPVSIPTPAGGLLPLLRARVQVLSL